MSIDGHVNSLGVVSPADVLDGGGFYGVPVAAMNVNTTPINAAEAQATPAQLKLEISSLIGKIGAIDSEVAKAAIKRLGNIPNGDDISELRDYVARATAEERQVSELGIHKAVGEDVSGFASLFKGGDIFVKLDGGQDISENNFGKMRNDKLNQTPDAISLVTGYVNTPPKGAHS